MQDQNKVNRETFLRALESVQPGLSPREIIEQSSCFVLKSGEVFTYNDETACRGLSGLSKSITGAVQAQKLLDILGKLKEEELTVEVKDGHLVFHGKNRHLGVRMEAEIALPLDAVEQPGTWAKLHDDFCEAVNVVQSCASTDQSKFEITCIHVHPKWVEACDNFQLCRWRMRTGIKQPTLIRQSALRHVSGLGMSEFSETEGWVHFRNKAGLILSCRRYLEDYPDLSTILKVEGEDLTLPKGLAEAADKADVFSSENQDSNQVLVELRPGKLRVKGQGVSGWYLESKKLKWEGKPMAFLIAPSLLVKLLERNNRFLIAPGRLKVSSDQYDYVSCLSDPEQNGHAEASPRSRRKEEATEEGEE